MEQARILGHLEVAFIEIAYAAADLARSNVFDLSPIKLSDAETIRKVLAAANRDLELAIKLLKASSSTSV